ncbi:uncharacterized protein LOC125675324 [Ostrea edulis]|uniref:uncharacterized protein LOC125675324 n=1 Tax=Ostrea edulis TaxID=37623 RepID=UPI0024AFB014|nr:uncharacterized protein LOC125675324 [Ostrea edulis]
MRIECKHIRMASIERKRALGRPRILTDSARKRAKREQSIIHTRSRVYLGDQYDRWLRKKEELGETHAGLAKRLLNKFMTDSETESADQSLKERFSTPITDKSKTQFVRPPDVSEISSALSPSQKRRKLFREVVKETSYVNPFDVTIDISEESSSDIDSDEEYEPSVNVTIRPKNMCDVEEITLEEQEFGKEKTEGDGESEILEKAEDTGPGIIKILCEDDVHLLTEDETCLNHLAKTILG